jgi:hypothetical protein
VIFRHTVATVLSLALLHLNVVRADAACGAHPADTSTPAAVEPAADHHAEHHAHHDAAIPAPPSDEEQCDAPQARDCCAAVATCAIAFDAGTCERESVFDVAASAIAAPVVTAPLSVSAAPEPPPPRV